MSTHTPQPNSSQWPKILLFLAAVGIPSAAAFKFADAISKDPLKAVGIALLYECSLWLLNLLRKVSELLTDELSQVIAKRVKDLIQKIKPSYKHYYAHFLTFQHRGFDIKGLSTQSIYALELEQVFVDLSINSMPLNQVSSNPIPSQVPEELLGSHTLWDYLTVEELKNQHLVILGTPGSGKTTLFKHLALALINKKKRRTLSRNIKHNYQLPFLLFLREYAEAIHENPSLSLVEAIQTVLNRWERPIPEGWVRKQLSKGKCLILLDGLDEVGDTPLREEVVKWVQQQMETYAKNRFLISSRPYGYRNNTLNGVMTLEVQPFTFKQVRRFVHNWYHANEMMSSQSDDAGVKMHAEEGARDLVRLIEQRSSLLSMAANPLLLTMISTIHRYGYKLPEKRVKLYAEIFDVFLEKRQYAHNIKVDLNSAECISVLQPLAYKMMVNEQSEFDAQDAQDIIKKELELVHESMTPTDFFQMVQNRSGLLLEREDGIYYFAHLTFQEYLAATYIHDQGLEAELITHLGESRWEETTRLYSAQTDATNVVEAYLKQATESIPHLTLALACLVEAQKVQPTIKPQLGKVLEQGIESVDPLRKKSVAEILLKRRLEEMTLIRKGVYLDTSLILSAEYQLFLDEKRALGKYHQPDHWLNIQFPAKQSLLPIVGIRPSAAHAFCQWLTEREQGKWQYRLPQPNEYQSKELRICPKWLPLHTWNSPLGYWHSQGQAFTFEWIQQQKSMLPVDETSHKLLELDLDIAANGDNINVEMLGNATAWINFADYRKLNLSSADDLAHVSDLALTEAGTLASNLTLTEAGTLASNLIKVRSSTSDLTARVSDLVHASSLAINLAHTSALAIDFSHTSDLARISDQANRLAQAGDLTRPSTNPRDLLTDLASELARASTLIFDLDRAKEQRTPCILDLALLLALLSICVSFSAHTLFVLIHKFPSKENKLPAGIQKVMHRGIDIYQRLEQLKKRREGTELACEGILIIKEHKQDKFFPGTQKDA